MHTVWAVTCLDKNDEPQIMTFDNPLAADACYRHFYDIYRSDVWIDECKVYGSFIVAGNESALKVSEYCVECDCFYHDCRGNEEPCLGFIPKEGSKYKTVELEVVVDEEKHNEDN